MNVEGLTRVQLEDTIARCKRALGQIEQESVKKVHVDAKVVLDKIFSAAVSRFQDPFGEDEDSLLTFLETEMKKQTLWVERKHSEVECSHDDCWYANNEDRVDEYKSSHHAVFRHDHIVHCDVCVDNVDEEGFELDEIYQDFQTWHKKQKKNKRAKK